MRKWQHSGRQFARRLPLLAAAFLFCGSNLPPPLRLALVIGNGDYLYSDLLPNAPRDAGRLTERLTRLGFAVEPGTRDLKKQDLARAVAAFGDKLRAAGPNVVGFFYYAGHAGQDAFGINYLLPVDSHARTPAEIRAEGTPVQELLKAMEDTNNAVNIVVLDACRNWNANERNPRDPKGLRDMGRFGSVVIAYATRPDETADEGPGLDSAPFSRRLIEALDRQPSDPIVLLLSDVKSLVYSDTDQSQYPMIVDGLTVSGRWSLSSGGLSEVPDKPRPVGSPTVSPFLAGLDRTRLVTFFRGQESLVDTLLARRDVLEKYEINTPARLAHFLGSIGFETGGFKVKEERFGYSAAALRRVYPVRVSTDALAQSIAGKPQDVANVIYADRLGNGGRASGDGWKYRGRGLFGFFITGRANYARFGQMIDVDLINAPDLANDPEIGFALSAAIWSRARANEAADAEDLQLEARRLRGTPGPAAEQAARRIWLTQAQRAVM